MSSAPDFSSTFDLVDDKLADAEKRLAEKRQAAAMVRTKLAEPVKAEQETETVEVEARAEPIVVRDKPKLPKKAKKAEEGRPDLQLVSKEHRRNLTLKVLEENEQKFNELFFKLQLKGDGRKKQDLADEALDLLFGKYAAILG